MKKDFFNSKGKLAGTLTNGVYRKKVNSKKHRMRMFGGAYAIDKAIVEELKGGQCTEVRILETDTDLVYCSSFEGFVKNGIERNFDGPQVFLPLKHFEVDSSRQKRLLE